MVKEELLKLSFEEGGLGEGNEGRCSRERVFG